MVLEQKFRGSVRQVHKTQVLLRNSMHKRIPVLGKVARCMQCAQSITHMRRAASMVHTMYSACTGPTQCKDLFEPKLQQQRRSSPVFWEVVQSRHSTNEGRQGQQPRPPSCHFTYVGMRAGLLAILLTCNGTAPDLWAGARHISNSSYSMWVTCCAQPLVHGDTRARHAYLHNMS